MIFPNYGKISNKISTKLNRISSKCFDFKKFNLHLNENAHTKVTKEAKAKFRKPFDKVEAGQSLEIKTISTKKTNF